MSRVRLDQRPVQHPRVARPHPADRVGVDAAAQQPDAGVRRGLARAHDDVLAGRSLPRGKVVDRNDARALGYLELRRRLRRDVGREVSGVDHPAPVGHFEALAGLSRHEGATAHVVATGKELDAAGADHPLSQHLLVVGADGRLVSALVQASLRPRGLEPTVGKHTRGDAVEGRGLVQSHEGVRVAPVPADAVAPLDHGHTYVGVVDQRVDKTHPHRPCTDHEVVDVHTAGHTTTQTRPRRPRQPVTTTQELEPWIVCSTVGLRRTASVNSRSSRSSSSPQAHDHGLLPFPKLNPQLPPRGDSARRVRRRISPMAVRGRSAFGPPSAEPRHG